MKSIAPTDSPQQAPPSSLAAAWQRRMKVGVAWALAGTVALVVVAEWFSPHWDDCGGQTCDVRLAAEMWVPAALMLLVILAGLAAFFMIPPSGGHGAERARLALAAVFAVALAGLAVRLGFETRYAYHSGLFHSLPGGAAAIPAMAAFAAIGSVPLVSVLATARRGGI